MATTSRKIIIVGVFAIVGIFTLATFANAQSQLVDSGTPEQAVLELKNPLGEVDPRVIVGNVIRAILGLVGSLALLMFIYGGFLWVTSAGNEEKVSQGKKIISWTALGIGLIFFSYMIVTLIINTIYQGGQNTGQTGPQQVDSGSPQR